MWQLKVNIFVYAFSYYVAKQAISVMADGAKEQLAPFSEWVMPMTLGGCLLLGLVQDKIGVKLALNISQLASAMIYVLALVVHLKSESKGTIAEIFPDVKALLRTVPSTVVIAVKLLSSLQHSMQLCVSTTGAILPFESPKAVTLAVCQVSVAYTLGMLLGGTAAQFLPNVDEQLSLAVAAGASFAVWVLNHVTFPRRQTGGAARAGPSKPSGRAVATKSSSSFYPSLILRHVFLYLFIAAVRFSRSYFNEVVPKPPAKIQILGVELSELPFSFEYVVGFGTFLVVVPALLGVLRSPINVLRFAFLAGTLVAASPELLSRLRSTWGVSIDEEITSAIVALAGAIISRVLYLVPSALVLTAVLPENSGQATAVSSGVLAGIAMMWGPQLSAMATKEISQSFNFTAAEAKAAFSIAFLNVCFLLSLLPMKRPGLKRD